MGEKQTGTLKLKTGLAEMLKGGVIMDVTTADQARIAEDAGAAAGRALERVPADIRAQGGVARMAAIEKIREIQETVSIPVMAKCRIGHLAEARILEALEVDFIDESEVLTPADDENHVFKHGFRVPFVCGCRNLGEALRRIGEGAAMMRTKGEAGSGDIVEGVRHLRAVQRGIRTLTILAEDELTREQDISVRIVGAVVFLNAIAPLRERAAALAQAMLRTQPAAHLRHWTVLVRDRGGHFAEASPSRGRTTL